MARMRRMDTDFYGANFLSHLVKVFRYFGVQALLAKQAKLPLLLTPLAYIIHMDVVNADIAGANICPCRQSLHSGFEQELETYI